ncbi:MAG: cation:proton antiporter [Gammaproteobacteria bacterium]
MHNLDLVVLSAIFVAGFACQWIAWRVKLPSILFLLLTGILAGPALGWLNPDELLGDLLTPVVSIAVAIILYEGSLTLKLSEIRGHGAVVRNLVTVGVVITWLAATTAAHSVLGWDIHLAALFGGIVTVSGPTVIMPLLRTIRPTRALSNVLRWEAILVDPLGAILAVIVFDYIVVSQTAAGIGQVLGTLLVIVLTGTILGIVAGYSFGLVLRRHWVPDYLRDYLALASVLLVFGVSEAIHAETGLLAVTVMGVWQANMRDLDLEDILDFKESLAMVLVASLFILLAARIELEALASLGVAAIGILLLLQFVAGPARAFVSSIGSELSWRERLYLGWIFPRGIVAAAVSALFALRLEEMGYAGADDLVPLVFTVIIGTVVIQGLTGRVVARALGIATPDPTGVLVVGANALALAYAEALHKAGHRVLVASSGWDGIREARMKGLPVFYGSAVSSYADRHLNLLGLGNLLALSHRPGINELACVRFRYDFGRNAVYTVRHAAEGEHEKHQVSGQSGGRLLFSGEYSISELLSRIGRGAEIKSTELTDEFDITAHRERYPDGIILFVTDDRKKLHFPVEDSELPEKPGSVVTALVPKPD